MVIHVRRIVGDSMQPTLRPKQIVVATVLFRSLRPGDIVIIQHQGMEKIKRIQTCADARIFVVGDNAASSIDSRQFGWIPRATVMGKVIWPTR